MASSCLTVAVEPARATIPIVSNPTLVVVRQLRTNPFPGALTTPVADAEGLTYDPVRNSIWVSDDALGQVVEIDYATGELRTVISAAQFAAVPSYEPGGPLAGPHRIGDNEGLAYDPDNDVMYLLSGPCCSVNPHLPTAYRFRRKTATGPAAPRVVPADHRPGPRFQRRRRVRPGALRQWQQGVVHLRLRGE